MNLDKSSLSIGGLAAETGISVPTLRAWERRHGLPVALRLPSGHRRYSQEDVDAIKEVTRQRLLGSSLSAAIATVRERSEVPRSSLMRTLQHVLGDVLPARLSKPTLVAISHAIEDEASARAERPVMVGAFQRDGFGRESRARWNDLSRTSRVTVVFAGTRAGTTEPMGNAPWMVPIGAGDSLVREWAVICDSAGFSACLVAAERLGGGDRSGLHAYEAIWTVEPTAVREVVRTALSMAESQHPGLAELTVDILAQPPASEAVAGHSATILINRIVSELDRRVSTRDS